MNQHMARYREVSRLNYFAWALLAMWTVVAALSLWWNLAQLRPETLMGLWWGHGLLWLLGLGGIIFGFNRLRVAHDRNDAVMSYPQAVETKNNSPQAQKPQETMPPPEAHGSLRPLLGQVPPKG